MAPIFVKTFKDHGVQTRIGRCPPDTGHHGIFGTLDIYHQQSGHLVGAECVQSYHSHYHEIIALAFGYGVIRGVLA